MTFRRNVSFNYHYVHYLPGPPWNPAGPGNPVAPRAPGEPGAPENPGLPANPGKPGAPFAPVAPTGPGNPTPPFCPDKNKEYSCIHLHKSLLSQRIMLGRKAKPHCQIAILKKSFVCTLRSAMLAKLIRRSK